LCSSGSNIVIVIDIDIGIGIGIGIDKNARNAYRAPSPQCSDEYDNIVGFFAAAAAVRNH